MSNIKLNKCINNFVDSISFDNMDLFYNNEYRGLVIGSEPFSYSPYYMSALISEAIKDKNNRYNIFEDNLENSITNYISKKIINNDKFKSRDKLKECLRAFFSRRSTKFICILPINGYYEKDKNNNNNNKDYVDLCSLTVYCNPLTVYCSPSTVYCGPSKEKINKELLNKNQNIRKFIIDNLNKISNHFLFTIIKVKAKDSDSATHIAQRILKGYTDCLQVINANPTRSYYFNKHLIKPTKSVKPIILSEDFKEGYIHSSDNVPRYFHFEELPSFLNKYKNNDILKAIDSIATKISLSTQLNSFENDIWTANKFIADGLCADDNTDKFTKLMIGLEAMFETKSNSEFRTSTVNQITEALVYIHQKYNGLKTTNIKDFKKSIKKMYDIRSKALHGEDNIISDFDVELLSFLATNAFKKIVQNFSTYNRPPFKNKQNLKEKFKASSNSNS